MTQPMKKTHDSDTQVTEAKGSQGQPRLHSKTCLKTNIEEEKKACQVLVIQIPNLDYSHPETIRTINNWCQPITGEQLEHTETSMKIRMLQ